MKNPVEITLLEQAKAGDYDAFEDLHRLLEPPITRFVRRLIGGGVEVEDIVQDTFISFYTHMDKIDPPENLRPYVFRIARNRSYDILRKQGRFEQLSLDDEPVSVRVSFDIASQQTYTKPEEAAHWLLLHLEVREAMEMLPETQRQALILYSEEEMTYAEIAEVMDVSIGTVKSRLFHAKKNLRGLVRPEIMDVINEQLGGQKSQREKQTAPVPNNTGETEEESEPVYTEAAVS